MRWIVSLFLAAALAMGMAGCAGEQPEDDPTGTAAVNTLDLVDRMEAAGWRELPAGNRPDGAVIAFEKVADPGDGARLTVHSREDGTSAAEARDRRLAQLELDPDVTGADVADNREFGDEQGAGFRFFQESEGRAAKGWYVRSGAELMTIVLDHPGEGEFDEEVEAAVGYLPL